MKPEKTTYSWFALQTRLRYEHFAAAHLRNKGYDLFLPVYSLEILNPDGSVQMSEWNALTGKKIAPHYLSKT